MRAPKIDVELRQALAAFPIRWSEPTIAAAKVWDPWPTLSVREWAAFLDHIEDAILVVRRAAPKSRREMAR